MSVAIVAQSGSEIRLDALNEARFLPRDIAHGLAHAARYNGHTPTLYTVAQHSVIASHVVPRVLAFAALVHDASEAWLTDVVKPLKVLLPSYNRIESEFERALLRALGLPEVMHPAIKHADMRLLVTEARDVLGRDDFTWAREAGFEPLAERIVPWSPNEARRRFLERFEELAPSAAATPSGEGPPPCPVPSAGARTAITTASGAQFDFVDPDPDAISIEDVARSLSHLCRFGGQTLRFHSIAQHCVMTAMALPPELAYAGLMSKAARAYLGDIPKSLKVALPDYLQLERRIERVVNERFGLSGPEHPLVRATGLRVLATEARDLLPAQARGWALAAPPLAARIDSWEPQEAMGRFLELHARLSRLNVPAHDAPRRRTRRPATVR